MSDQNPENITLSINEITTEQPPSTIADDSIQPTQNARFVSIKKQEVVENPEKVPKYVFIVPYRDRDQQQKFFAKQMAYVLEDVNKSEYKIFYIHQCDKRSFNRGAMKNIGFLFIKDKYPNNYKDITMVFNDVDTMPYSKNFLHYETKDGSVKHFYGYKYALGGIVSIKGKDFENMAGFPNFWSWGHEDNLLQRRVLEANLKIDRSEFYPLMDKNIFQMKDGLIRLVNRGEFDKYTSLTVEGWKSIFELTYDIDETSGFVNVRSFNTGREEDVKQTVEYDMRNGNKPFNVNPSIVRRGRPRMGMII